MFLIPVAIRIDWLPSSFNPLDAVVKTIVNKTPVDVGFPAKMNWTSPIIRKWIKREFDIQYSDQGTRELLGIIS